MKTKIHGLNSDKIFNHFKKVGELKYNEEVHGKLLIDCMLDSDRGTYSSFCVEAMIADSTFFKWVNDYELFKKIYYFSKMVAREVWEQEGRDIKNREYQIGTIDYSFEHWKLIGWSRFGVSKNARLKLSLNPDDSPAQHYAAILRQAADGDFTASEFKQLMEAVHQVFELQKQINELKSDLAVVSANTSVQHPFTNKGIAQKD